MYHRHSYLYIYNHRTEVLSDSTATGAQPIRGSVSPRMEMFSIWCGTTKGTTAQQWVPRLGVVNPSMGLHWVYIAIMFGFPCFGMNTPACLNMCWLSDRVYIYIYTVCIQQYVYTDWIHPKQATLGPWMKGSRKMDIDWKGAWNHITLVSHHRKEPKSGILKAA